MGRLIDPPIGLRFTRVTPLSGPRTIGAGSSESTTGFIQTTSSVYGGWRLQLEVPALKGTMARRYRGWVAALHGGANATFITLCDPDKVLPEEAGLSGSFSTLPWGNGLNWGNGQPWRAKYPPVAVQITVLKGSDTINLHNDHWGDKLQVGDYLGFSNQHWARYIITEVISPSVFRVWPTLRKDVPAGTMSWCHKQTLVMRLENESAAPMSRAYGLQESTSLTMIEVPHDIVVKNFSHASLSYE